MTTVPFSVADYETLHVDSSFREESEDCPSYGCLSLMTKAGAFPSSEIRLFFNDLEQIEQVMDELKILHERMLCEWAAQGIRYPQPVPKGQP